MTTNQYTEQDIIVLSDREHVRLRPNVVFGSTIKTTVLIPTFDDEGVYVQPVEMIPAVFKAVGEIIDNCIDEFTKLPEHNALLTVTAVPEMGTYSIADNGRGIPIGINEQTGLYTPQVTLSMLRAGRNFKDDEKEVGVIGANGVGAAITNMCSSWFEVEIKRENKCYTQRFEDGALIHTDPEIKKYKGSDTGTAISFQLDSTVFSDISIDELAFKQKMQEVALCNPSLTVSYNGECFKYSKGFADVLVSKHLFKFSNEDIEVYVINAVEDCQINTFTWINSSYLFDGGLINTQLVNAFCDAFIQYFAAAAKKAKIEIKNNDVKSYFAFFTNAKIQAPLYDTQAKTRQVGPDLRRELQQLFSSEWGKFSKTNKIWLQEIFDEIVEKYKLLNQTKALTKHKKTLRTKIPNLRDANSNNRSMCRLYIVEGLSAASNLTEVRDPMTMGSYPLGGKINATWTNSIAEVLKMEKLAGLLSALGLVPGHHFTPTDLRYGKVIIATDSDPDGSDIFATVVCLLYKFWPEMFTSTQPYVYRLMAPNVCAVDKKTKERIYFRDLDDFRAKSSKYKQHEISYYKGLGSMELEDWKILMETDDYLMPIQDINNTLSDTLELSFGKDTDMRKIWLTTE